MANLPSTGKRLGTRRPRCIPAGRLPSGRNRYAVPELYVTGAKPGVAIRVGGSCGPLQKKTLRTLALMPLNIGIAMVGCDPKLSVTSCTGFPCPWRMRRVCRPQFGLVNRRVHAASSESGLHSPWRAARGLERRVPWAGNVNDTVAPHGGFGPAAIFCGIGRFHLRSQRSGEYRQAGQRWQDRRKASGGAGLARAIMGLPGRSNRNSRWCGGLDQAGKPCNQDISGNHNKLGERTMKRAILGTIAAAALSATPLWAEDEDLFGKLDKNSDGVVTADEVEGDAKGLFERSLRKGDKDGDKKLTKEEFAASQKETDAPRQPLNQGGGPGRPGGGQFNPREIIGRLDANKDGKVSKDEAQGPVKENFERFDGNKDGFISEDEIGRPGGGQFNPREMFARQDTNKDGKVSKDEAQGPIKEAFDRLDANSDGAVSEDEFGRFAGRRPDGAPGAPGADNRPDPRQLEAVFEQADANKDGKLTKDEIPEGRREFFARMMERAGADSISKEQFARFMTQQGGRPGEPGRPGQPGPGGPPGGGRPPLFVALDADNDGELSAGEIEASSKSLLKLDKNSDGKLTRDELFPGSPDGPPRDRPGEGRPDAARFIEQLRERIKAADADKDGKISKEEAGKDGVPPGLKERFDQLDANGDGQLDSTELDRMLQSRREGGDRPQGRPEGRRPEGDRPERGRPDAPRRE